MRVLILVHGFPPRATGGTEVYTHDFARALRDRFGDEVVVFTREADPGRPEFAVRRERRDGLDVVWINYTFRTTRSYRESYRQPRIAALGAALADEVRPDVVHAQHLTCLSTDLVGALAGREIPVVVTLNDYWLFCHRGQLLDRDERRCDGPSVEGCARCLAGVVEPGTLAWAVPVWRALRETLPRSWSRRVADLGWPRRSGGLDRARRAAAVRLADMHALVPRVAQFLAPSRTVLEHARRFGIPDERLLLQEQGIDQSRLAALGHTPGNRLRLGFLGSLMVSKAPHVLLEAVAALDPGEVQVDLYGALVPYHGDDSYRRRLDPLLALPHVRHHGSVPHGQVPAALSSMDVLVVPSVWIENAPFVIREAFAAGVPVVASRLGGMAELVEHERNGLLVEPGDAEDLRRAIRRVLDEPGLLERLRAGVPRVKTIEEDAAWTREVYVRQLPRPRRTFLEASGRRSGTSRPARRPRLAVVLLNHRTPVETWLAARALFASSRPVDDLVVVDNGSGDGSAASLRARLPSVRIVEAARNLGFAGGANVGIRTALEAGAELVGLVNSDAILARDTLERLEAALGAVPDVGIVGPVVLSRSDPGRVASCGMTFDARTGRMRHRQAGAMVDDVRLPPVVPVDGVSGCCMLVRRAVFERVGLFAEELFFSFEDLDFCLRAASAGFGTACVASALAYHEGSATIGRRSPERIYYATRNHLAVAARHGPSAPLARLGRAATVVALNLVYALAVSDVPRFAGVRAAVRGAVDHVRGRYGPTAGCSPRPDVKESGGSAGSGPRSRR